MTRDRDLPSLQLDEQQALRALWAAVIWRGLLDAVGRNLCAGGERLSTQALVREARVWLRSRDFAEVCGLAGMNPVAVRERLEAGAVDFDVDVTPHRMSRARRGARP